MSPSAIVIDEVPTPPFIARLGSAELADRGASAGADRSFRHAARRRARRGLVAAHGVRPHFRVVADSQIENRRAGHDRHERAAEGVADLLFLEVLHHAAARVEAERAAARRGRPRGWSTRARPAEADRFRRSPGAPPRTSTAPTVFGGARITLQPVGRVSSVRWPTLMPGTRVMPMSVVGATSRGACPSAMAIVLAAIPAMSRASR